MNTPELIGTIAKHGVSRIDLAADLGISTQALYNKINGVAEFKASEIKRLAQILNLSMDEVNYIFFGNAVN